jgi:Bacteriocin-protection, YdeI or OmpD-Associated/Domain of unknown function (DUF1905)
MFFAYTYEGALEPRPLGNATLCVVYLDRQCASKHGVEIGSRQRVAGEIDDVPFDLAWQPTKEGTHFLMVSPALRKQIGKSFGETISIRFNLVDEARTVIADELALALRANSHAKAIWESFSPGKQRSLNQLVASAKQSSTRASRAEKLLEQLVVGIDPMKKKAPQTK